MDVSIILYNFLLFAVDPKQKTKKKKKTGKKILTFLSCTLLFIYFSGNSNNNNNNGSTSSATSSPSGYPPDNVASPASSTSSLSSVSSFSTSSRDSSADELEHRLTLLKRNNGTLEQEFEHMNDTKQQVDCEIERILKRHKNHCYLTLDDLARFETMLAAKQEVLVVVNAPYDTDITVHQPPKHRHHSSPRMRAQPYPSPVKVNNNNTI